MRVDIFTEWVSIDDKNYIINLRTNAVDEVDASLATQLQNLKKQGSFSNVDSTIEESTLEKLISKGYVINYSDKELACEKNMLFESHKEKLKISKKVPSLLLDNSVGKKWCMNREEEQERIGDIDNHKLVSILSKLKTISIEKEVDIWFDFNLNNLNLSTINGWIEQSGLKIRSIYTTVKTQNESQKIKADFNALGLAGIMLNIKKINDELTYHSIAPNKDLATLKKVKRLTFCQDPLFFCPFIYRTFFINLQGDIHYCARQPFNEESDRINIFEETPHNNTWNSGMFDEFCEREQKNCPYSFYCAKMCAYQENAFQQNNGYDNCQLSRTLKMIVKKKIENLLV